MAITELKENSKVSSLYGVENKYYGGSIVAEFEDGSIRAWTEPVDTENGKDGGTDILEHYPFYELN
jgi:hypothetical protein